MTGAGKGIGRATAIALAAQGDRVMAVARTEPDLRSLARTAPVDYLAADLSTAAGCAQTAREATRRLGQIDILVNNAGTDTEERPVWDQATAAWRQVMAVNLDAPFELTRLLAGQMTRRRWGRIVMVSSTAGTAGAPSMTAYCASKHAILGLMRSVACDVAPFGNVTCNAVAPGWVRTPMSDRSAEREAARRGVPARQVQDERAHSYAARRIAEPAEVASVIAFLASDAAAAVNGATITIALGQAW